MMKTYLNLAFAGALVLLISFSSCSSSTGSQSIASEIVGKYAYEGENQFDFFKDTIEVRQLDNGKFDIAPIAYWSKAKVDDPQRPVNKVAGIWNKGKDGSTLVAELQASDKTLRVTEALTGSVRIFTLNTDNGTLEWPLRNGEKRTYKKIAD